MADEEKRKWDAAGNGLKWNARALQTFPFLGRPGPLATIFIFSCFTLSFLEQLIII